MSENHYNFEDDHHLHQKGHPLITKNKKQQQEFTLEPKAKNIEHISQITPEMQLRELCPVWKTSFSPQTTDY